MQVPSQMTAIRTVVAAAAMAPASKDNACAKLVGATTTAPSRHVRTAAKTPMVSFVDSV